MRLTKADKLTLSKFGFYQNDLLTIEDLDYTFQYKGKSVSFVEVKRIASDPKQKSLGREALLVSLARSAFKGSVQFGIKKDIVVTSWNKEWLQ
ncbi:hypothetical protein [Lactococcus allomyrinae]|uniref:Uncharacterized protein n=1 Tax=Lactococcus allomyrinae TaxID=2419773 RepID=A0A387BBU2_9LACT|nr:hypothetical protein [Lactococcus allomyrinae]AYF99803.1 hypothetical protein D7I46_01110 [Lactococcus allomyrinae]